MAEIPDLEYLLKVFARELSGKRIAEAECLNPDLVRMVIEGDFAEQLTGLKITKIRRRGPFLILRTSGMQRLAVKPADLAHFKFPGLGARRPRSLIFVIHMEGGPRLWFLDPDLKSEVYLTSKEKLDDVPTLMDQGADPLGKNFSPERLRKIARRSNADVRTVLMDQKEISHIGKVYADEILFDATIHPKTPIESLSEDDLDRLYDSILNVLETACERVEAKGPPIENPLRDGLKVWGRKGMPCKRCGEPIQSLKTADGMANFCAKCQKAPSSRKSK